MTYYIVSAHCQVVHCHCCYNVIVLAVLPSVAAPRPTRPGKMIFSAGGRGGRNTLMLTMHEVSITHGSCTNVIHYTTHTPTKVAPKSATIARAKAYAITRPGTVMMRL